VAGALIDLILISEITEIMKSIGPLVRHEGRAPAVAMMVAAGL
jgi:hypothetical protein